ncbi:hypothetical protein HJB88_25830 [Rhizobium sp. NZLR5]|uniref:hypothetical protein n=1 Tax=Rhizobium sp. NZLR5 TaxID=2731103 RepID=UPI001C8391F6|nr:hypothetical protein [Rhizobium sp. NZLR5]MBX5186020.1 hypothetical protein [Rhizobium sp. NZLR5]
MDEDEKNYPDHGAHQRVDNEILQCISLADWQSGLDSGANDISTLLNDTWQNAIDFKHTLIISEMNSRW